MLCHHRRIIDCEHDGFSPGQIHKEIMDDAIYTLCEYLDNLSCFKDDARISRHLDYNLFSFDAFLSEYFDGVSSVRHSNAAQRLYLLLTHGCVGDEDRFREIIEAYK